MTIEVALFNDTRMVTVDDRTALMGGSFYMQPHLQPYSPLPLRWCFDQLIKYPKATLIDVGANTGSFTLMAKHHPGLTVHAFEPVELAYRVLGENIHLNDLLPQVVSNRMAVSNYNGVGVLHTVHDIGGLGVSMVNGSPAWHKAVDDSPISVCKLDTYCREHGVEPRFIKIDTEGAEKYVLEGAQEIIQKYHPFLLFEYSQENANQYGYPVHEMVKMVEEWGYTWSAPEGMDLWCVHKQWEALT
jgi:FkbM family methyltransferase